jgi:hypothetical protein
VVSSVSAILGKIRGEMIMTMRIVIDVRNRTVSIEGKEMKLHSLIHTKTLDTEYYDIVVTD